MAQQPKPPQYRPLSGASVSEELARRSRRRRLRRAILVFILVAVIGGGLALVLTGKAIVPYVSELVYPVRYRDSISASAHKYGVDPYLVASVVKAESGYDPLAISSAGAVGLMQLLPQTANYIAGLRTWKGSEQPDITKPDDNVELGTCYLAYLEKTFGGNDVCALAAYNAGEGTVRGWIDPVGGTRAFDLSSIRYGETLRFVQKVQKYRGLYERIYRNGIVFAAAHA